MNQSISRSSLALLGLILIAIAPLSGCVRRYYTTGSNTTTYGSNSTSFGSNTTVLTGSSTQPLAEEISTPDAEVDVRENDPRDWWHWRGPEFNGISRETGLVDDFDLADGNNVAWRRDDLGGRSTPITMRGRLYTIVRDQPGTAREGEKVVCVDLETGETIWENRFNVWLSDVPDTRVGWSSVVGDPDTGDVFALGVCGYFQRLDGSTGETKWSYPLHEQFGLLSTYGGRTNFPVVVDDYVIISAVIIGWGAMAKPAHRFLGFDKESGEVAWFSGTTIAPYDTSYSSPTVSVLGGQKALVFGSGDGGIWAFQPRTGKSIWQYKFSRRGLNVAPLVIGDTVYSGHSEENVGGTAMGAVVAIDALAGTGDITTSGEKWKIEELMVGKSSPVAVDNIMYCFDDRGKLFMIDRETGEQAFPRHSVGGTMMRASPLFADGKIYAFSTSRWQILEPDEKRGVRIVNRGYLPDGEEVLASPIASYGKVFVQTTGALYCLIDQSKKPGQTELPPQPEESPVAEDNEPALVQIVPAELLIRPGRIKTFSARLFNSRGQQLDSEDEVEFALEGPGDIAPDGTFLAPSEGHIATYVTASIGDLTGRARVRVVPRLPWNFDFDELDDVPITWVGARYRHVLREVDGSKAMVKVTTIPKGTRSRCWFGQSDLSDYTIQADVKGALTDNKMPDIGLIAQGYTLDLQGANQKLQIRSWVSHDHRAAQVVDFPWEADQWYTMKLLASNVDGEAVLKGKVWPRGEDEPEAWSIELTDPVPNMSGSPGLYGNAKDAELYLDNITVEEN